MSGLSKVYACSSSSPCVVSPRRRHLTTRCRVSSLRSRVARHLPDAETFRVVSGRLERTREHQGEWNSPERARAAREHCAIHLRLSTVSLMLVKAQHARHARASWGRVGRRARGREALSEQGSQGLGWGEEMTRTLRASSRVPHSSVRYRPSSQPHTYIQCVCSSRPARSTPDGSRRPTFPPRAQSFEPASHRPRVFEFFMFCNRGLGDVKRGSAPSLGSRAGAAPGPASRSCG